MIFGFKIGVPQGVNDVAITSYGIACLGGLKSHHLANKVRSWPRMEHLPAVFLPSGKSAWALIIAGLDQALEKAQDR